MILKIHYFKIKICEELKASNGYSVFKISELTKIKLPYLVCLCRRGCLITEVALDSCEATISSLSIAETEVGAVYRKGTTIRQEKDQYLLLET